MGNKIKLAGGFTVKLSRVYTCARSAGASSCLPNRESASASARKRANSGARRISLWIVDLVYDLEYMHLSRGQSAGISTRMWPEPPQKGHRSKEREVTLLLWRLVHPRFCRQGELARESADQQEIMYMTRRREEPKSELTID